MSDSLFNIPKKKYAFWKAHRNHLCQTPGMLLWVAIHNPGLFNFDENFVSPKNWQKEIIREFKYPVEKSCRCKYCRYYRMFKK